VLKEADKSQFRPTPAAFEFLQPVRVFITLGLYYEMAIRGAQNETVDITNNHTFHSRWM
jgi:hypothetical protein